MVSFSGAAYRFLSEDINPESEKQSKRYGWFFKENADDHGEEFKVGLKLPMYY